MTRIMPASIPRANAQAGGDFRALPGAGVDGAPNGTTPPWQDSCKHSGQECEMQVRSSSLLGAVLCVALWACEDAPPNGPTPPACTFALSATTLIVPASGGQVTVVVTTTNQCSWTASSDRAWMAITGGANGSGSGSVTVVVEANPGPTIRTGTLTVAGQAVAVREEAQPACTVTLTPPGILLSSRPYTGTFEVTSPAYCQWTAVSGAAWLTVTAGGAGTGNGTVTYAADRNRDPDVRTGAVAVGGASFVVTQEGDVPAVCDYSVTPVEFTPCMSAGYTMSAMVTTQDTCAWTAAATSSWITLTEGQSGVGSGLVSFRVSDNWDAPRQGIVEVRWPTVTAGQNLRVLQAGCSYAVTTSAISIAAAGGASAFDVFQQSDPITCGGPTQNACLWSAVSSVPWITVTTSMPRVGDDRVNLTVTPNTTGATRIGTIVVRDKTVTVTQAGS
jgi:hypothetical protein